MTEVNLIYTTFKTTSDAKTVVEELLNLKLIACANIGSNVQSLYMWEGKLSCQEEVSVILKTTSQAVEKTIEALKKLHQYETPCIVVLPVSIVDKDFLEWIRGSMREINQEQIGGGG
jgi:periplasmic divalent cation tolerance protein